MTHEINIYGDIVPFKFMADFEYDLKSLNNDLSGLTVAENDELIINIHTFGGCTNTAFGIYNKLLRFKTENKINLTTRVDGWCASSGVIILLAGDKRVGNQFAEPFVHNAWTLAFTLDKKDAEKIVEDLTNVDNQIATLYSERTNIAKDKAIELMNADNFVTADECLKFGFYTELENVYSAENTLIFNSLKKQNLINRNLITNKMSDKKSIWNKIKKDMNSFLGVQNKIIFTADNTEIDFYELDDNAEPAVDDKAQISGEDVQGEYVMASGETYVFDKGVLTEIKPKVDTPAGPDLAAANAALKNEIEELKSTQNSLNKKVADATEIIKTFNSFKSDFKIDEDARNPKGEPTPKRNLFNNLK